jgi:translation initiation factor 3 subunit E
MTASSSSMEMTIDSSNDNQDPSVVPAAAKTSWDLTCKISPYLDLHMMFPLLEFVDSCYSSTTTEVAQARLALLRPTHMVDYAMDIYRELYQCEEVPQEMEQQKAQVYERLETLRNGCQPLIDLCTTEAERVSSWFELFCM